MCKALCYAFYVHCPYNTNINPLIGTIINLIFQMKKLRLRVIYTCINPYITPYTSFLSIIQDLKYNWTLNPTEEVERSGVLVVLTTCLI